jgi:putative peptidoglycan lipid II flippase
LKYSAKKPYATAQAATTLTALAILSPVAGLVLEMTLAWRFGASSTVDAFRIATLILVFGNQLFLSHLLPNVLVPLLSEYRTKDTEQEGWKLAFSFAGLLGLVSLILVAWMWFEPETLIGLLGPGLTGAAKADAVLLVRYFSLAFFLTGWSGVMGSILYIHRIFWLPPACQLLTNLFVIMAIFSVGSEFEGGSIAVGILLGSLLMFGLHLYFLGKIAKTSNIHLLTCLKMGNWEGVLKAIRLSFPLIGMIFASQWGTIIINRTLSELPPGTLANFGYAFKLLALVGILPVSLSTVMFPSFSDVYALNNASEFTRLVTRVIRMTLLLIMPIASVLFMTRFSVVKLLFDRGAMSGTALAEISRLFGVLIMGAPAGALMAILFKVSFSVQDTKSPAVVTFISALIIMWLVPFTSRVAGADGIAVAYVGVTWIGILGLLSYQFWRYRMIRVWEMIRYLGLLAIVCAGVILSAMAVQAFVRIIDMPKGVISMVSEIVVIVLSSIIVAYGISQALKISEVSEIRRYVWWQARNLGKL